MCRRLTSSALRRTPGPSPVARWQHLYAGVQVVQPDDDRAQGSIARCRPCTLVAQSGQAPPRTRFPLKLAAEVGLIGVHARLRDDCRNGRAMYLDLPDWTSCVIQCCNPRAVGRFPSVGTVVYAMAANPVRAGFTCQQEATTPSVWRARGRGQYVITVQGQCTCPVTVMTRRARGAPPLTGTSLHPRRPRGGEGEVAGMPVAARPPDGRVYGRRGSTRWGVWRRRARDASSPPTLPAHRRHGRGPAGLVRRHRPRLLRADPFDNGISWSTPGRAPRSPTMLTEPRTASVRSGRRCLRRHQTRSRRGLLRRMHVAGDNDERLGYR